MFDGLRLRQHIHWPTKDDHVFDLLVTDSDTSITDVQVDGARRVSDHSLITAVLAIDKGL